MEGLMESFLPEIVSPDRKTAWNRAASVSGVLNVQTYRVLACKVNTGLDIFGGGSVDDIDWVRASVAAPRTSLGVTGSACAIGVNGIACARRRARKTDGIVSLPRRGGPVPDDILAGFGIVIGLFGIAYGTRRLGTQQTTSHRGVQLGPALTRGPAIVRRKLGTSQQSSSQSVGANLAYAFASLVGRCNSLQEVREQNRKGL
jgi:hypothetical protein